MIIKLIDKRQSTVYQHKINKYMYTYNKYITVSLKNVNVELFFS